MIFCALAVYIFGSVAFGEGSRILPIYSVETPEKKVAITFNCAWKPDDIPKILSVLEKYEAKATFFIGGCWADDNVDCLKAIYADGHEIGNHGYFHKDHAKLNLLNNQKEINDCNRFIELAIGIKPTLFAPPSGSYGNEMLSASVSPI